MTHTRQHVRQRVGGTLVALALALGGLPRAAHAGIPTIDSKTNASAFARLGAELMAANAGLTKWRASLTAKLAIGYQALDESDNLRQATEANQFGQLTGFGRRLRSTAAYRNALDSTGTLLDDPDTGDSNGLDSTGTRQDDPEARDPDADDPDVDATDAGATGARATRALEGEWKTGAAQLLGRFLISVSTGYQLRNDPGAFSMFQSAHTVGGATRQLLGDELDMALGTTQDDDAAVNDGDVSVFEDRTADAEHVAVDLRRARAITAMDLMAADTTQPQAMRAAALEQAATLRASRQKAADSIRVADSTETEDNADPCQTASKQTLSPRAMGSGCRAARRMNALIAAPGWLTLERRTLRGALKQLAPETIWEAGAARRQARGAARSEARLVAVDSLVDELIAIEHLDTGTSTGRAAQLSAQLAIAQTRLQIYEAQGGAADLEAVATRLAATRRHALSGGHGTALGFGLIAP